MYSFKMSNYTDTAGIFLAYNYGNLYIEVPYKAFAFNMSTGRILWEHNIGTLLYERAVVIVGHGKVFFPSGYANISSHAKLIAFDAFSGRQLWEKNTYTYGDDMESILYYSPAYDMLFTLTYNNKSSKDGPNLTAINGTTGKVVWSIRDKNWHYSSVSVVPSGRYIYVDTNMFLWVKTSYEEINIYNITTGKRIYSFTVDSKGVNIFGDFQYPDISISNGVIYLPDCGVLYAIGTGEYQHGLSTVEYITIGITVIAGLAVAAAIIWKRR